jgi:hypothetical protein
MERIVRRKGYGRGDEEMKIRYWKKKGSWRENKERKSKRREGEKEQYWKE